MWPSQNGPWAQLIAHPTLAIGYITCCGEWVLESTGSMQHSYIQSLRPCEKMCTCFLKDAKSLSMVVCFLMLTDCLYFYSSLFSEPGFIFSVISWSYRLNEFFWNDRKKFGHNIWKGRLMNTVMARFNTVMGQMTKMSQWKKGSDFQNRLWIFIFVSSHQVQCNIPTWGSAM